MKKYKQNILQIFVLAILLVSGAFVFAFSGPTSTPLVEDAQGPIKATGVGQYIGEKSFADLINLNGYSLSILGKQDNSILGNASSQFLNVSNSVTVDEGDVFVTSLSGTGTQNVCLNSQHKLVRCSGSGVFIDEEAPISECYPVVYSEVSSDYNSPNYLLAKQLCATKTTKQNCLDHGYAVWNQGRPPSVSSGPWMTPAFAMPDQEMQDNYAWNSYGNYSHLLINLTDMDYEGDSLPYYSDECNLQHEGIGCYRSLGPVCTWGAL